MPAGYDAEVAELFRDFRAASNLTESDLAARLSTRLDVVQALEQGALFALPPWAETCRVINNYGLLLNLDVRPLLRRIYAQVEAGIVELRPKPMPEVPFMMPPESGDAEFPIAAPAGFTPTPYPQPSRPHAAPPPPDAIADRRFQPRPPQMPPPPMPAPQRQAPQARAPQARAPQTQAPPMQAPQRPASPARAPQVQAPQPMPRAAPSPAPAPAKAKRPKSAVLKWSVVTLLVLGMGLGIWVLFGKEGPFGSGASPSGKASAPSKPLDPDDPRNRKADRLPSPNGL